jgi:hypothetical protein
MASDSEEGQGSHKAVKLVMMFTVVTIDIRMCVC